MGVPKFYRWISERYPCLSEVIREFQIPDFDNLYLDMNGIIHTCSHPNDDDPHFRITEENIFAGICHYIEFLFKMIKPKKVFFMAVDGVAPRAKMNQQRGRRFRTAKAAVSLEDRAKACGEELPKEARFDSNCITPGTDFMARLHTVLKNFIVYKISSDKLWQNVKVYLSGHETPGEGEHKIMDFIRYEKSQTNYNPNTRHCLYGLDADLIMLGLCSHEPYFSLLREEVKFGGKKNQKRIMTPEETTFHLLHISLLRDYLSHEFSPAKDKLPFQFDIEQIIDDFVLMSFLVGNDFIPHLPQLHIHHDALPILFKTYRDVLPQLNGYINEKGILNLERFEIFLHKLSEYDFQKFEEMSEDFQYLEGKSKSKKNDSDENEKISTSNFLSGLGFSSMAISKTAEFDSSSEEDEENEEEDSDDELSTLELEFNMHKVDYYINKLDFTQVTPEVMKEQAEGYIRAIQWNLHYYYNGVVSWSWYYPHHYSPYISDVKDFKNMEMKFELGKPFLPFQQLLAVLPKLSKDLLPMSYQKLMCDKDSPLIDYYPDDFETDLNGKQQEWEAIVLIPFINENLLLKFAAVADKELCEEERKRNSHGPHLLYVYTDSSCGLFPSFLPGYFSTIADSHAKVEMIEPDFFRLSPEAIVKGLCKDVIMDKFILGFPTLRSLEHTARLKNEKVKVFQMVSQKENMMLTIKAPKIDGIKELASEIVGKTIYVGWPHLREAFVTAVSDGKVRFSIDKNTVADNIELAEEQMVSNDQNIWLRQTESFAEHCCQRWGIYVGTVDILVFVKCLTGFRYIVSQDGNINEEKQWENTVSYFAVQMTLRNIDIFSPDVEGNTVLDKHFSPGLIVFLLTPTHYGNVGTVCDSDISKNKGSILVNIELTTEPDLHSVIQNQDLLVSEQFMPGYIAAQQLGMEPYFISRITGTFLIQVSPKGSSNPNRVNLGLNLKFNRKNEEVQGFSRKKDNQWLYSEEAVKTLNAYLSEFADFFEKLYKFINNDIVYLEDIYPDGEGHEVIDKITNWLKSQTCSSAERQKCGMEKLDSGIISAIEQKIQSGMKDDVYHVKKHIKPHQLYSPFLCKGIVIPDSTVVYHLFDRVINVWYSSSVPLGLKGTVVGIRTAEKELDYMYEVLFDKEFFGGLTFGCSIGKGYRVPPNALINISHGERQRRYHNSPVKISKHNIPRLNRTALFDSAVKQLQPDGSPVSVQVLQKKHPQSSSLLNKPFYKADADMFQTQAKNSPVTTQIFSSNSSGTVNKQFVTPKAGHLSSKTVMKRNPSNSPQAVDIQNFWTDLKKINPESPAKLSAEQGYGQKVSLEELFQGAQNQRDVNYSQNIQIMKRATTNTQVFQRSASDILLKYCIDHFGTPPTYNLHNYGNTHLFIATVTLPNGEKIASTPYLLKEDAFLNAAERALTNFGTFFGKTAIHARNQSNVCPDQGLVNRLSSQNSFKKDYRPVAFPPNTNFPPPPPPHVFPFSSQCFDVPLMRHPQPLHSTHIPDSFVKTSQMVRLDSDSSSVQKNASPSCKVSTALPEREVFYLPDGGTVTVKSEKVISKISDNSHSNMFVPAQVMKQAIKTPHEPASLSNAEWPDLPAKKNDSQNLPEKCALELKDSKDGRTINVQSYSDISKNVSLSPPSNGTIKPLASQSAKLTVLKPKKSKRIAANFQNL